MRHLTFILFLFLCTQSLAQETLKGRVFENKTKISLSDVRIQNLRTKKFTQTDANGRFDIAATLNDLLVFTNFGYQPDTLFITSLKPAEIFLEPKPHMLDEVNVMGQQIQSFKTYDPEFHNQSVVYQRDANGNYKGGIAIRIWSNKKKERQQRKLAKQLYTERNRLIIDTVFGLRNLSRFLPLQGDELLAYRIRYIPTVKQYTNDSFNLLRYIDSCYKLFQALPPEKRHPEKLQNAAN